jgi:hypothetical protein
LSGIWVFLYSSLGLVIKTLGIDAVTALAVRLFRLEGKKETEKGASLSEI